MKPAVQGRGTPSVVRPRRSPRSLAWTAGALLVLPFLFWLLRPVRVVPRLRLAPAFSFVDQDGGTLTSEDLRGEVFVLTFGYLGCSARCYPTDSIMRALQDRLAEVDAGDVRVRLVSVSFDAERDTPAELRAAAVARGAKGGAWTFAAAGRPVVTTALRDGFEVWVEPDEGGGFRYSPVFVVVDGQGVLRARYWLGLPDVDDLVRDLRLITREARVATGPARLAYEAAHLFACYAR